MVKKLQKGADKGAERKQVPPLSGTVKDSAQQIWLAGLGAFSKAQEEGGKVFEALVKEGMALQRKTQSVAEEKLGEVTSRMTDMADGVQAKAGQHWDKLESIFEARVAKALNRLGVPSRQDIDALIKRIDELSARTGGAKAAPAKKAPARAAKASAPAKPAARPAAKRAARKTA